MEQLQKDVFFEQLVTVKKTSKIIALQVAVWLCALLLTFFVSLIIMVFAPNMLFLSVFVLFGSLLLAFKMSTKLNLEYEYIITNGEMDIDQIIGQNTRQRIISFKCSDVTDVVKYNSSAPVQKNDGYKRIFCCSSADYQTAFTFTVRVKNGGDVKLTITPNKKMIIAMCKFLPFSVKKNLPKFD